MGRLGEVRLSLREERPFGPPRQPLLTPFDPSILFREGS